MKVNFTVVALPTRNNYLLFFRAVKKSMGCFATNTGHCQGPVYVPVVLTLVGNGVLAKRAPIKVASLVLRVVLCIVKTKAKTKRFFDFA